MKSTVFFRKKNPHSGMTLIELVLAMTLLGIVTLGASGLVVPLMRLAKNVNLHKETQNTASEILREFEQDMALVKNLPDCCSFRYLQYELWGSRYLIFLACAKSQPNCSYGWYSYLGYAVSFAPNTRDRLSQGADGLKWASEGSSILYRYRWDLKPVPDDADRDGTPGNSYTDNFMWVINKAFYYGPLLAYNRSGQELDLKSGQFFKEGAGCSYPTDILSGEKRVECAPHSEGGLPFFDISPDGKVVYFTVAVPDVYGAAGQANAVISKPMTKAIYVD